MAKIVSFSLVKSNHSHTCGHIHMRNDPYTHFSQQPHNKLTWLLVFYYFFTKRKENKTKKVIKYYQPHQLVVELLWKMSVGIISLFINMILGIFIAGNLNNHALIKLVNSEFNFTSMQVISASRFTTLPSTIPTFWFLFQKLFPSSSRVL
jgi:hypothetical protein